MNRKAFAAAFPATVPVMLGYLTLGAAFGLLLNAAGFGVGWAALMSGFIYAGSAQFLGVELLTAAVPLAQAAVMTFILNFRHLVYGLSMLEKFCGMGWKKPYMIFSLTDETYALLSSLHVPVGVKPADYYFAVSLLDQLYWVAGSLLGGLLGTALTINTQGADFAMTALFIVIAVGQWENAKSHLPALLGGGISLLTLVLFGPERFLVPALAVMILALLVLHGRLDREETA
ncbi:MAG: branched-chain amino acid ABC transporter permease [Oscillospiraceae bacterium]|nr:branched-chain amino acid ABC transporter permease [Oscillospiraceae bacterium]